MSIDAEPIAAAFPLDSAAAGGTHSAGTIVEMVAPVLPDVRCEQVAERFSQHPELFAQPVVQADGKPVGLLNRFRLLERLSRPFGRDLFVRRPIVDCLESEALLIDESIAIEDIAARLFTGDRSHILDGFIVTRGGRYLGVGTGVTLTRALAEVSLARAQQRMQVSARENEAKSAFVAMVSHEIRTPLNGVLGIADLLRRTEVTGEQRELIDLLRFSSQALLAMVDDVLDYSKIQAGRLDLELIPFDLRTLVENSVKVLQIRATDKNLHVSSALDPRLPPLVVSDPTRLRQVLLNIGGNAVKFTEEGRVEVRVDLLWSEAGRVKIEIGIRDTGIGIAPDKQAALFEPFSQVDASTSRQFGGSGLGLAICREIVEKMGSRIRVSSAVGEGTCFVFDLVCATAPAETLNGGTGAPATAAALEPSTRGRVLLAEDNAVNQLVASRLLRQIGYEATVVADGAAAITALSSGRYDLVLMDCNMPGVDGFEATERIRQGEAGDLAARLPIIALTASTTVESRDRCERAGMNGFLTKPITLKSLERGLTPWLTL